MEKFGVQLALEAVAEARKAWGDAQTKFNADVEAVMGRLLNEGARNFMSAEQIARASGMTVTRVRAMMRQQGLNPTNGRSLLAKKAAETLAENAALMGMEPHEFDLMSPLAYLPMGSELKKFLETQVDPDELLDETPSLERLVYLFKVNWEAADELGGLEGKRTQRGLEAVLAALNVSVA